MTFSDATDQRKNFIDQLRILCAVDFFKMAMYRVIRVSLKLIFAMASMVVMSSANCSDPGIPRHGSRTVWPSGRFSDGTIIIFSCNSFYNLTGAKKILCSKGRWSGKRPTCQPPGCPLPTPNFPNAHLKYQSLQNTKGSYVEYACNIGYTSNGRPTKILCDKDHESLGYFWNGNITCEKIRCGRPPRIAHGNVTTGPHSDGARTMATYYCFSGYKLLDYNRKQQPIFRMSCVDGSGGGVWQTQYLPKCVKTCPTSDVTIDHGEVKSNPFYEGSYNFTENMTAIFVCEDHYKLEGNQKPKCMESGLWSAKAPHCVLNVCEHLENITNGEITFNNSKAIATKAPIWTEASYKCRIMYRLIGNRTRQCRPGGHWSGQSNPVCEESKLTCRRLDLANGGYKPVIGEYRLNQQITPSCNSGYLLWGPPSLTCKDYSDDAADWLYLGCVKTNGNRELYCDNTQFPECVTPEEFEKNCRKVGGHATDVSKKGRQSMSCEMSALEEVPDVPGESQQPNRELDKMTIVIASTGSTLGALVVLLAALYCFRQRIRRIRRPSYRSRRYSDDDRIAFIAYAGDVHFILPSYDEAISQVERSPPSFESVVEGTQGSANRSTTDSNGNQNTNQSGNTESNHTTANTNRATEDDDLRTDQELARGQSIRIVSNPLANNGRDAICSSTTQNADHASSSESERRVGFSDEHTCLNACGKESSPNRPSEDIPSSSSEEDLTSNQTQPLLSNSRMGVRM